MYYLLIPVVAFIFFMRIFTVLSEDINHKFKNFDYKYSYYLRSSKDLHSYIKDLNSMNLTDGNYDLKIFPPYSDYNINQDFYPYSNAVELFDKD